MNSIDLNNKRIIIASFGYNGVAMYEMLKLNGINAIAFFDKNTKYHHSKYKNTPIFPWSFFYDSYVVISNNQYVAEFKEILKNIGYEEEYILSPGDIGLEEFYDTAILNIDAIEYEKIVGSSQYLAIQKKQIEIKNKLNSQSLVIRALPIIITTRCTLNCEYCFAKMPYFSKKEDVSIDFIIEELDRILSVVDYVEWLEIFGGEPLLHKELWKIVEYINKPQIQEKIGYSIILTNGTVLFDEKTIDKISENKYFWKITSSPYGKFSTKQFELYAQCNESDLFYYQRPMPYWHKFGIISEPDNPEDYTNEKCKSCCCYVPTFFDGKIYSCETLAFSGYLKMFPDDKRNYLDIFSDEFTKENFRNFLQTAQPAMAWCNANHKTSRRDDIYTGEIIPVAGQAKGIISYKRYE